MFEVLDHSLSLLSRVGWETALRHVYLFTLVAVRLSGLMVLTPVFGQASTPMNVRIVLIIALAFLTTPTLDALNRRGFERLDSNGNGRLEAGELPEALAAQFDDDYGTAWRRDGLSAGQFAQQSRMPETLVDYGAIALGELAIGLALGLGVYTAISSLQLAGHLADQQSGFGLGEVFNPDLGGSGSMTGTFLFGLGIALWLTLPPVGGHAQTLGALLRTFEAIPPGRAWVAPETGELLSELVRGALELALRAVAPLLIFMSLVDLSLGFLGHSAPQINLQSVGYGLRALLALGCLTIVISDAGPVIAGTFESILSRMSTHFGGP